MEASGIRTASLTHFPKITQKINPPRALHVDFPLGRSFGNPKDEEMQKRILLDLLHFSLEDINEKIRKLPYKLE